MPNIHLIAETIRKALRPYLYPSLTLPLEQKAALILIVESLMGMMLDVTEEEMLAAKRTAQQIKLSPEAEHLWQKTFGIPSSQCKGIADWD